MKILAAIATAATAGVMSFGNGHLASQLTPGPSFLFINKAKACNVEMLDDKPHIVFDGLSKTTTVFSDRPFRADSNMDTAQFMGNFDDEFGIDLPNTAFLFEKDGVELGPYVAVIKSTSVDGKPAYQLTQSLDQAAIGNFDGLVGGHFDLCVAFIDSSSYKRRDWCCSNPSTCTVVWTNSTETDGDYFSYSVDNTQVNPGPTDQYCQTRKGSCSGKQLYDSNGGTFGPTNGFNCEQNFVAVLNYNPTQCDHFQFEKGNPCAPFDEI